MTKSNLTLTFNDKEIKRKLAQVENSVRVEATEKGLHALAQYLIAIIKVNIIDRKLVDTGNLLGSVQVDEMAVHSEGGWIAFGPHTAYAARLEFGFAGMDTLGRIYNQPARPYIRPALDEHGQEALDLMGNTIGSIIEGSWSK